MQKADQPAGDSIETFVGKVPGAVVLYLPEYDDSDDFTYHL